MAVTSTSIIRRGVLVTDIPYVTDNGEDLKDKLEIHFQNSKKGGGGEVESIVCRIQGDMSKAIVIFKSEQDVKNVLDHTVHTFCDSEELQVQPLPQVFSVLHADFAEYYWKILKVPDVHKITTAFPKVTKSLSYIDCDFDQLKDLTLEILKCGPVGDSVRPSELDHESMMQIISQCLEVTGIPYITDDKKELDSGLREYFKTMTGRALVGLNCGVEGDLKRAIAVFSSGGDMELVTKTEFDAENIMFFGERLSLTPLPQVMKVHATFNEFYIRLVPKLKRDKLRESNPSINKKNFQLIGSLFDADIAVKSLLEIVGIKQIKASETTTAVTTSTRATDMSARKDSSYAAQSSHKTDSAEGISSKSKQNDVDDETEYKQREDKNRNAQVGVKTNTKEASRYPGKAIKKVQNENDEQLHINDKQGAVGDINQDEDFVHLTMPNEHSTEPTGTDSATHDLTVVQSFDQVYRDKQNDDANLHQTSPKLGKIQTDGKDVSEFTEIRKPLASDHRPNNLSQPYDETSQSDSFKETKRIQQEDTKLGSQSADFERDELKEGFAQVDKIKFEYIKKTKADELQDIETRYGVCISTRTHRDKDPPTHVVTMEKVQRSGKKTTSEEMTKAGGEFLKLYSQIIPDITVQTLACSGMKFSKIDKAVKTINKKFGDTLVVQEGSNVVFCGNESTIKNVISEFKLSAGISEGKEVTDLEITVNCVVFQFLNEHNSEFKKIQQNYQVTFELKKDPSSPTECGVLLKPVIVGKQKKKLLDKDAKDAKEEFIGLYQKIFQSIRRTSLQLPGVSQDDVRKALATTQKKFPKIILTKPTNDGDYILCTEEVDADLAVQCFRVACGIRPAARKLKKPGQETASSTLTSRAASNASYHKPEAQKKLAGYPSVFSTNEGVQMIALTEDITKQEVDAIVNAANCNLKHDGGVAKAISTAAGPNLQKECDSITNRRWSGIQTSECVETKGYNLPCQIVIHAVGPYFPHDSKNFDHYLRKTFLNVLHHANKKGNIKSIAIPLISSGNYGGPLDRCTEALTTALFEFSKERKTTTLQQVYLVNIQDATTQAIQQSLRNRFHITADKDTPSQPEQGQKTYLTKSGLKIIIEKGDITKTKCDVIVNAANENLGHHRGVAQAISSAAGPSLQQESHQIMTQRKHQPLQVGEVVETGGYNLPCKKVAHVVGPRSSQSPNDAVFYSALKGTFLNVLKYTNLRIEAATVALPLISSGVFAGSKVTCSKALFDAVKEFIETETTLIMKTLLLINIDDEATNAIVETFDNFFQGNEMFKERASIKSLFQTSEGLELQILQKDITSVATDAIVNPTDVALQHVGTVSNAIKVKAGPQLEQQCREIRKKINYENLKSGQIVYTSAGNLPCKYVVHTASPTYIKGHDSQYKRQLKDTLIKCFETANDINAVDIALPVIGSGISGAPVDICISSLIEAIASASKGRKLVSLKRVVVVSTNSGLVDKVKAAFTTHFCNVQASTSADTDKIYTDTQGRYQVSNIPESQKQFSATPGVSIPLLFEAENELKVILLRGDITKLKADLLLKSANGQLMPDDKISYLINEQAGAELQKECKKIMKDRKCMKPGEYVTTGGYDLPYEKVVHFMKPQSSIKWEEMLVKIMLFAKTTLKARTVAVSTSSLSLFTRPFSAETLNIDVLMKIIQRFSKCVFDKTVKSITIVCADDEDVSTINNNFSRHFKPISVAHATSTYMQGRHSQFTGSLDQDTQLTSHSNILPQATGTYPNQTANGSQQYPNQPTLHSKYSAGTGIKHMDASISQQYAQYNTRSPMSSNTAKFDPKQDSGQTQHIGLGAIVTHPSTKPNSSLQQPHCLICRDATKVKKLECCDHTYCSSCIEVCISRTASCKECKRLYCVTEEKTLKGKMTYYLDTNITLPDSKTQGAIVIVYDFPPGIQGSKDPQPGYQYNGTLITAYLPHTTDGCKVVKHLRTVFIEGKLFTIKRRSDHIYGVSPTDLIPHKLGKAIGEDYPDQKYMDDVKKALGQHSQ